MGCEEAVTLSVKILSGRFCGEEKQKRRGGSRVNSLEA